jgi:hypothetical protein
MIQRNYTNLYYLIISYIITIPPSFSYIGYLLRLIKFQILFNLQYLIAT